MIINGVSIAGPTLAYSLRKADLEVLPVEAAPQLRTGGYVIDFGLEGYDLAEKMGLTLGGEGRFVHCPKAGVRHSVRNLVVWLMRRLSFVVDFFIGRELRDRVQLPDYGF
jgi:2-polyprenyl-6-methoxyphenol hydroxylase-like FAD-dependent oxidoreductase